MPRPGIDRSDIDDLSFVDADELRSSGSLGDAYRTGVVVLSTTGSTGQVRISGWHLQAGAGDDVLQVGDIFVLSASIPAQPSASYRVESVVNSATFTVSPSIATSVFGTGTFRYPPGAKSVGFNPSGIAGNITSGSNVQDALRDIGLSLGTGVFTGVPPEYNSIASEVTSSTNSTSFQTKVSLEFFAPSSGTFYLIWYCEFAVSSANKTFEIQTTWDGVQAGLIQNRVVLTNQFAPFPGFLLTGSAEEPVAAGPHTASIQFRMVDAATLTLRRARMGAWRVE